MNDNTVDQLDKKKEEGVVNKCSTIVKNYKIKPRPK